MNFKVKLFNSEQLDEINTRRLKIDLDNFKLPEFLSYMKSLHDIGDAETITIYWKDETEWIMLNTEKMWNRFVETNKDNSKVIIKLNIYYGNVHISVTCDICGNIVIGDRYKCLQCDDYDICQICFQVKPNCHKQHCFLLLRTPTDALKFLRSIPVHGISDFRVIDIDLDGIPSVVSDAAATIQTDTTEETSSLIVESDEHNNATMETDESNVACSSTGNSSATCPDLSSVPQEYLDSLPANILDGLEKLKSMGFHNISGPLVALLVEKNGNLGQVIEELEYSLKKK